MRASEIFIWPAQYYGGMIYRSRGRLDLNKASLPLRRRLSGRRLSNKRQARAEAPPVAISREAAIASRSNAQSRARKRLVAYFKKMMAHSAREFIPIKWAKRRIHSVNRLWLALSLLYVYRRFNYDARLADAAAHSRRGVDDASRIEHHDWRHLYL